MSQSVVSSHLASGNRCNIIVVIAVTFTLADCRYQANGIEPVNSRATSQSAWIEQREQWGIFEVSLSGTDSGNPFVDVELSATFKQGKTEYVVRGFYDGGGNYRI